MDTRPICHATRDAYSYDRYGETEWRRCADYLAELGLTAREIESVLRSKVMRWAADNAAHEDATKGDFVAFLTNTSRPFRGLGMRSRAGRRFA